MKNGFVAIDILNVHIILIFYSVQATDKLYLILKMNTAQTVRNISV